MLTAAVYSAVAGMALHYAEPPASFENRGQKIRRPSMVAAERLATCLDTTLLMAAAGKLTMDFGALNRDGGERRLNVAITRARRELVVFSGFTADQIDPTRTRARAAHHLKAFLDYAERGAVALPAQDLGSVGEFESPFEQAVAAHLEKRGWTVVPQVGISGFRIDLGVRHPDLAGAYLAGVECDGATYHRSATARDRDKVREQVLRGLGWDILRVWSTDWWFDPAGCAERLHAGLNELLNDSRARRAAEQEAAEALREADRQAEEIDASCDDGAAAPVEQVPPPPIEAERVSVRASGESTDAGATGMQASDATTPANAAEGRRYRITDLSGFSADPGQFFEFGYRDTLRAMIEAVVATESPLRTDVLAQRIARAHGWLRTGGRIREEIARHLHAFDRTSESSGEFIWKKGAVSDIVAYRPPIGEEARRAIGDIALAELAAVARDNRQLLDDADPERELARRLGVDRLAAVSRARLTEAIARARQHLAIPH